ncbi:hypothetical protein KC573_01235 [candidate division WWE3 bacterium]|uniref:Uncharacterized protein n=1 Tax=candidate division WWE3 bacterium TaxID=2053526 RepID=A0A955LVM4_UNCKA|nr:hypothetical protein [candidate division WWE3 bacterium]
MQEDYIEKVKAEEHDIVNSINNEISKKKVFLSTLVSLGFVAIILVAWILYSQNRDKELQNFSTLTSPTITPIELPSEQQDKSQIDTTNWQNYTNEEYGYSIRYPEEWNKTNADGEVVDEAILSKADVVRFVNNENNVLTIISVRNINSDISIEEYLDVNLGYQINEEDYKRVSINGTSVTKYTITEQLDANGLNSSAYFKVSPTHLVSLSSFYSNENDVMQSIFEGIVMSIAISN